MSKRVVVVLGAIGLVVAVAGGTLFFLFKTNNTKTNGSNSGAQGLSANDLSPEGMANGASVYNDDSGFSFKYPSDFVVTDITPTDDNAYYSLLEVKRSGDVIRISVKDGNYQIPPGAAAATLASASATLKLGDFKPKQYTYEDNGIMKTLTLASSQGVSYAIDGVTTNDSEKAIYNSVVASFVLGKQSVPSTSNSADTNTIDEGTEVVQ